MNLNRLRRIVLQSDTISGRLFDAFIVIAILLSVIVAMADSVDTIKAQYGSEIYNAEWIFTVIFSVEYLLRIICSASSIKYIFSFFGIVDFLAVLPAFLEPFFPGAKYLGIIKVLRVLRIFRILKMSKHMEEARLMYRAIVASWRRIFVFLFSVVSLIVIFGSLMYLIEGEENGFSSIPASIYWAVVTLTTVGYGDISPGTALGQALASIIMLLGYSIIAVPTGLVVASAAGLNKSACCPHCGRKLSRINSESENSNNESEVSKASVNNAVQEKKTIAQMKKTIIEEKKVD